MLPFLVWLKIGITLFLAGFGLAIARIDRAYDPDNSFHRWYLHYARGLLDLLLCDKDGYFTRRGKLLVYGWLALLILVLWIAVPNTDIPIRG